jgi:hypothetical protein
MQIYLFIGGPHDGLNFPVTDDIESVRLPSSVTGRAPYTRSTLSVGDVSITIYIYESLAPEEILNRLVESYIAWAVNQPAVAGSP